MMFSFYMNIPTDSKSVGAVLQNTDHLVLPPTLSVQTNKGCHMNIIWVSYEYGISNIWISSIVWVFDENYMGII